MSLAERSARSGLGSAAAPGPDEADAGTAGQEPAAAEEPAEGVGAVGQGQEDAAPGPVAAPASERSGQPEGRRPAARHCWVVDPPASPGRWPGLLVEWRRQAGGWCGRVVWVAQDEAGPVVLEAWLPAGLLVAER